MSSLYDTKQTKLRPNNTRK